MGKNTDKNDNRTRAAYDEFEDHTIDEYDYLANSAASWDQTGLIPSLPQNAAELESYQDIYPFAPPLLKNDENNAKG